MGSSGMMVDDEEGPRTEELQTKTHAHAQRLKARKEKRPMHDVPVNT